VQRSHTLPIVLTLGAACGSGPTGPKGAPTEPIEAPPTLATPERPVVPPIPAAPFALPDAGIPELPDLPKLACEDGTTAIAAPYPDPTWACTRPDGTKHGAFITLYPDQSIAIEGHYKDGKLDGAWKRHHPNGATAEEGAYATGMADGTWRAFDTAGTPLGDYTLKAGTGKQKRWLADGPIYSETQLKKGVPNGYTKVFDREGHLIVIAKLTAGKLDGDHLVGGKNTLRIEETFVRGVRRGPRKIWQFWALLVDENYDTKGALDGAFTLWRDKIVPRVQGTFEHGKRVGSWIWTDRNNKTEREGDYIDGKKTGPWFEYTDEKLTFQGIFTDGKPDGEFIYYDRNSVELGRFTITDGTGTMLTFHPTKNVSSRTRLQQGQLSGKYEEISIRGRTLVEGNYLADRKHGWWREWNEAGALLSEEQWKRGKLDGAWKKYVDGKLAVESTYKDGMASGVYTEYRAGKPALVGQFVADKRTGTWISYDNGGAVTLTATYKDGVLDGPWRQLEAGTVVEGTMVAGRRAGTWTRTDRAGTVTTTVVKTP
jgi:antitoxin component YwqK of YwqJK toxin-antitoxin module